jgi:hypothetical protein
MGGQLMTKVVLLMFVLQLIPLMLLMPLMTS